MLALLVGAVLFAIPIGILVFDRATGPSPYEQLDEMWKDPTKRSRVRRMILGGRRATRVPPPRPPMPEVPLGDNRSEAQLIDEIADEATRMVYADWLEQRGDLLRAAFVRGEPVDRAALDEATGLSWRAATSNAPVPSHECEALRWPQLRRVPGDTLLRECPYCTQRVRYCATAGEQRVSAARDELAILDPVADP